MESSLVLTISQNLISQGFSLNRLQDQPKHVQGEFDPFASKNPVLHTYVISQWMFSRPTNSPFLPRNRQGQPWVSQRIRPRRNRKSEAVRSLVRENLVTPRYLFSFPSKTLFIKHLIWSLGILFILYSFMNLIEKKKFLLCLTAFVIVYQEC